MKTEETQFKRDIFYANMGINPKDDQAVKLCSKQYDPDANQPSPYLANKKRKRL